MYLFKSTVAKNNKKKIRRKEVVLFLKKMSNLLDQIFYCKCIMHKIRGSAIYDSPVFLAPFFFSFFFLSFS